jgi:D-aminopeptidase
VVGEVDDSWLNDMNGFHVKTEDAFHAIDVSAPGPVAEGNVGGGTGAVCNEFKGGIGTASRVVQEKFGQYTVGVLVQCNFGLRENLMIAGVPVGREIGDHLVYARERGSIIVVVATDAPLLPHQLKAMARRVSLGLARVGSYSGDGSGDIFIAFSTANPSVYARPAPVTASVWPNEKLDELFAATAQATEEAIVNSMVAADTMTGFDGRTVIALPHDRLREALKKYNRLAK